MFCYHLPLYAAFLTAYNLFYAEGGGLNVWTSEGFILPLPN